MNAKVIVPFFAVALAACSSSGPQASAGAASGSSPAPASPVGGDQVCDAGPVANLVGQPWSDRAAADAQQRARAGVLRVLKPGQVMTMEYNPRRLTIVLDDDQRVSSARCG